MQALNDYALAEAKDDYLKAKQEYENRQATRQQLQDQNDYIINTDLSGQALFQMDRDQSKNYQTLINTQPVAVKTVE